MKRTFLIAGAVVTALASASATTLEKLTFKEAVKAAESAVVARALSSSVVSEEGQTYTETTFEITSAAFGEPGSTVTLRFPGGQLSGTLVPMGEVSAGSPTFFEGSESLLLIDETDDGSAVVGFNQGIYPVLGNGMVALPREQGGMMSVSDAFTVINEARTAAEDSPETP
ncbi:hypothetical protein HK107_12890 [Parvularcula sp. ZS-1/3]|uniref:Uncharacterized protein n=1 Tax=Parvularcula mediterranea TaxID=2732508 RepID=A0A7Y3RNA4_9PROT|nr:hypothetical protein [Parvularcula mediterranea]NNU17221.1 hypothetical protein [Parvularcula mediterranea]